MATRAHAQAEPIPGYRLIERLGGGGFGEVWKCEAPGGLLKAIKFVHGSLQGSVSEEAGAHQELKSLKRVQAIRHPYILSLERYDIIDGQLMIIMELADKNLWERHKECTAQGLPGIPREELLRYIEEASEALDLMNIQYGLQHLDIKPQNLFLVHNHVKVADFGLVKDLEGMNTQVTGGVTPVYAAPETFDGVISRYCDQYNLAIVYQELLTGQRPFAGTNVRQLLMQHLTGTPDLSSLPPCDKEVIGRALAKKPEDRFPSCTDMVQALRQAGLTASLLKRDLTPVAAKNNAQPAAPPANTPTPSVVTPNPGPATPVPASPNSVAPSLAAMPPPMAPPPTMVQPVHRPPSAHTFTIPVPPPRKPIVVPPKPEVTGDGVLFPALVVGIGGMGLRVLRQLRQSLHECCGAAESLPNVSFMYIDTDPETVSQALAGSPQTVIRENEIVLARLNKPSHYLKPGRGRNSLDGWLNMNMLCRVPRNQVTPDGLRMLGRLAFADNARSIVGKMKTDLAAVTATNALSTADRETRLGMRSNRPKVYVLAGLGGGTGSGMFIDVAYVARRELVRQGYPNPEIVGVLLLPAADRNARKNPALVNTFAALTELNHFSSPDITYQGHLDDGDEALTDGSPPFSRCIMLGLPEEGGDSSLTEDVVARGADYLARELASRLGRTVDKARTSLPAPEEGSGVLCQTFGSYKYSMPRRALMDRVGQALTRRLVRNWLSPGPGLQKAVRNRINEETNKRELTKEGMIQSLQAACEKALEISPETAFDTIVHENFGGEGANGPEAALETVNLVEQIIGHPQEDENAPPESTPMIEALDEAARHIRADWERQLADFIKSLIDDPRFRVAGADEATQQIMAMFSEVIRQHGTLLEELYARAEEAYNTIENSVQELHKGSWWPGRKSKLSEELREALIAYPRLRYQGLVLECLLEIYQQLIDKLPKKLEEVAFARQRLTEFVKYMDDRGEAGADVHLGPGRHFLPGDCQTVEEAVEAVNRALGIEELQQLDQKVQAVIRRQYKSLMAVCLSSAETMKELKEVIQEQAMSYVDAQLGSDSIASMYLEQHTDDAEITEDLAHAFEESAPSLIGPRCASPESRFMVTSRDPGGDRLGKLAKQADEEVQIVTVEGASDVFFYRERSQVQLAELPQLSLMAEDAYRQMTSPGHFTPHTRTDVTDWKTPS